VDLSSWLRALLIYAHLLLCGYALYVVVRTDLLVLRRRVAAAALAGVHRRLLWVLAGLWLTGLAVVVLDLGPGLAGLTDRPKLLTKLCCVGVLSANAVLLRWLCFPRLVAQRPLRQRERMLLSVVGAVSTTSWLAAAFIGVAKPMAQLGLASALSIYGLALLAGVAVALWIGPRRLRRPTPASDSIESGEGIECAG
jgi:hypothetical protein